MIRAIPEGTITTCAACAIASNPTQYRSYRLPEIVKVETYAFFRYACGHSHCYVCIRIWLEKKWTCPECVQVMNAPPFRHYAEEAGIAHGYFPTSDKK